MDNRRNMETYMTLDDSAIVKLKDILAEENNPNLKLRIFVQGGGCSGFSYGFTFDEEVQDYGHEVGVAVGTIFGAKAATFTWSGTATSYGRILINTYATAP